MPEDVIDWYPMTDIPGTLADIIFVDENRQQYIGVWDYAPDGLTRVPVIYKRGEEPYRCGEVADHPPATLIAWRWPSVDELLAAVNGRWWRYAHKHFAKRSKR